MKNEKGFSVVPSDDLNSAMTHVCVYAADADSLRTSQEERQKAHEFSLVFENFIPAAVSDESEISVVVVNSQSEIDKLDADHFNLLLLIVPAEPVLSSRKLASALVYRKENGETDQTALEKVFSGLIDYMNPSEAMLLSMEIEDLKETLAYGTGRYIAMLHGQLQNLRSTLINSSGCLQNIPDDGGLILIVDQVDAPQAEQVRKISSMIGFQLPAQFDGNIVYAWRYSSTRLTADSFCLIYTANKLLT